MADGVLPKPKARPRGRSFEKGQPGNPAGRRAGSHNNATLAGGAITPGEAGRIADVVHTFVRAIETSDFDRRLQLAEASIERSNARDRVVGTSSDRYYNR